MPRTRSYLHCIVGEREQNFPERMRMLMKCSHIVPVIASLVPRPSCVRRKKGRRKGPGNKATAIANTADYRSLTPIRQFHYPRVKNIDTLECIYNHVLVNTGFWVLHKLF